MPSGNVANKGTNPDEAAWGAALKHRPSYRQEYACYHETYLVKERGVKKWIEKARTDWIAAGCPAGGPDFPPLDDPPKMLTWWLAHMKHAPGDRLMELAGQTAAPASPASLDKQTAAAPIVSVREAVDVDKLVGLDLAGAAVRQRKLLEAAITGYESALRNPATNDATINLLAKRADDAVERLRKVEDSLAAAEKSRGHLIHINDLRAELAPMLVTLATSLPIELTEQLGIERARAVAFVDRWFRHLRASRFLEGVIPSLTPATAAA